MPNLSQLQEKRAELAKEIRSLSDAVYADKDGKKLDRAREFTSEENETWTRLNADYDANNREIERAKRLESIDNDLSARDDSEDLRGGESRGGNADGEFERRTRDRIGSRNADAPTEETRRLAFQGWCRAQMDLDITEEQRQACERVGLKPNTRQLSVNLAGTESYRQIQSAYRSVHSSRSIEEAERRALSATTFASGGATVPDSFVRSLEINMLAFGGVLQAADTITTSSGEPMIWPTANDTGNSGRRIGAGAAVATNVDPSFAQVTWNAYKYTSDAVLVDQELLEDSAFDIASVLGSMLGERLGRILASEMTTGDGAAMPYGIVNTASLGVTAASQTAIAADELFNLEHSVNPAYRTGASWMMHDNVLLHLRKLKDGNGGYLWQSGMLSGSPDSLLGYPITISMEMASSVATTNKTILFGRLSHYKVRRVRGMRLYRLQERYRDNDQDGFVAFLRADGNLLSAGTAPVKYLVQA